MVVRICASFSFFETYFLLLMVINNSSSYELELDLKSHWMKGEQSYAFAGGGKPQLDGTLETQSHHITPYSPSLHISTYEWPHVVLFGAIQGSRSVGESILWHFHCQNIGAVMPGVEMVDNYHSHEVENGPPSGPT